MKEDKIAHLGFIQNVIARMGGNSFLLKGWSVTLVAAIFALSSKDADQRFILLAYFPVLVFWFLDAFFLHQEKLFRKLYDEVVADRLPSNLFSMDTTVVKNQVDSIWVVAVSKTLLPFHGLIILVIICAMYLIMAPHS